MYLGFGGKGHREFHFYLFFYFFNVGISTTSPTHFEENLHCRNFNNPTNVGINKNE